MPGSKPARIQRVLYSRPVVSHPGDESPERRRCSLAGGDALRQLPKLLGCRRKARRSTTITRYLALLRSVVVPTRSGLARNRKVLTPDLYTVAPNRNMLTPDLYT